MSDTFYFSHDYNARADEKIKRLVRKHNMVGYGVYWSIVEDLYNNANALRLDYEGIAYELRVDCDMIKSILHDFDLFVVDGDIFGSLSVQKRIDARNDKSKKARASAIKRWGDANALQTHSDGNAIKERKEKERKEKERKEKEREETPVAIASVPSLYENEILVDKPLGPEKKEEVKPFNEQLGDLIVAGIEAKAERAHQQKKENLNKPDSIDAVVLELTKNVPQWPPEVIRLRAEQWYEGYAGKYPNEPWRVSNKLIKNWPATLRNKITYWKQEDLQKQQGNEKNSRNNRRAAIESGAVKRFD